MAGSDDAAPAGLCLLETLANVDRRRSLAPSHPVALAWKGMRRLPEGDDQSDAWRKVRVDDIRRRWADPNNAPSFAAPKVEDFLQQSLDHVTKSAAQKKQWAELKSAANLSGASAHATASAVESLDSLVRSLQVLPSEDPAFDQWRQQFFETLKSSVQKPLKDALTASAGAFNNAVIGMRRCISEAPPFKSLKPALDSYPPSESHLFGNQEERFRGALESKFYVSSLSQKAPARASTAVAFKKKGRGGKTSYSSNYKPYRGSSSSYQKKASSSTSGNARGRAARGGGGANRK